MVLSLLQRDKQPEIMDQPGLAAADHEQALRALSRINWISGVAGSLWSPIRRLAEERRGQPLRVLDVASGGGDVVIRLASRARRAGLPITFTGARNRFTSSRSWLARSPNRARNCGRAAVKAHLRN